MANQLYLHIPKVDVFIFILIVGEKISLVKERVLEVFIMAKIKFILGLKRINIKY
ncbi:Uncharacterised protein [uncultured archaeon]|nr:Uncharacterised protein [uncultured archaeon]